MEGFSLPKAPEWVHAETWTREQQEQELTRRFMLTAVTLEADFQFTARQSDILLSVPPKCGTTWLSYVCHLIRMGGSQPDFHSLEEVVPMIEFCSLLGVDPNTVTQPAHPRLFATHVPYDRVPRGSKVIACFRDPKDIFLSLFLFLDSLLVLKGRVELSVFAKNKGYLGILKRMLDSLVIWWEHRHDKGVLILFYEDLKEDHDASVRRIAQFMGAHLTDEEIGRVVHATTHAEMYRHREKFDLHEFTGKLLEMMEEVSSDELVGRVRKNGGKVGEGEKRLTEEVKQSIEKEWQETVTAKLGFRDFNELRQALKKELSDKLAQNDN